MANMLHSTASLPPPAMAPLPAALDSLSGAISRLLDTAEAVRSQVLPVMCPSAPVDMPKDGRLQGVAPASSPMVESVQVECRRVDDITAMLADVLRRLEV